MSASGFFRHTKTLFVINTEARGQILEIHLVRDGLFTIMFNRDHAS